jgi:hypothetical protein
MERITLLLLEPPVTSYLAPTWTPRDEEPSSNLDPLGRGTLFFPGNPWTRNLAPIPGSPGMRNLASTWTPKTRNFVPPCNPLDEESYSYLDPLGRGTLLFRVGFLLPASPLPAGRLFVLNFQRYHGFGKIHTIKTSYGYIPLFLLIFSFKHFKLFSVEFMLIKPYIDRRLQRFYTVKSILEKLFENRY